MLALQSGRRVEPGCGPEPRPQMEMKSKANEVDSLWMNLVHVRI